MRIVIANSPSRVTLAQLKQTHDIVCTCDAKDHVLLTVLKDREKLTLRIRGARIEMCQTGSGAGHNGGRPVRSPHETNNGNGALRLRT